MTDVEVLMAGVEVSAGGAGVSMGATEVPTGLAELRSPEVGERQSYSILAIPLGATEQHGPHLPIGTDTVVAVALCEGLAARVPEVVVAPAVPYGASGEHAGLPGTLSIGTRALEFLLLELVRSSDAFRGVVLVNGHGGNLEAISGAVELLRSEGRHVLAWSPTGPADDSHAGHTETSVMLRLRPASVAMDLARPGNTAGLRELMPRLRSHGVAGVSPNGVLGNPVHAGADHGQALLDEWTRQLIAAVEGRFPAATPRG